MKRILFVIATFAALAVSVYAQYQPPVCHDEMVCTPIYGCRWVTICR